NGYENISNIFSSIVSTSVRILVRALQEFLSHAALPVILCCPEEEHFLLKVENVAGIFHRALDVMGDHHHRDPGFPVDPPDELIELCSHDRIKPGHRLIQ